MNYLILFTWLAVAVDAGIREAYGLLFLTAATFLVGAIVIWTGRRS